jgi:hypothetical protein
MADGFAKRTYQIDFENPTWGFALRRVFLLRWQKFLKPTFKMLIFIGSILNATQP